MKLHRMISSVCMIWTILSLYQSITNILLFHTTSSFTYTTTIDETNNGGVASIGAVDELPYILQNPLARALYRMNHNDLNRMHNHHHQQQQQQRSIAETVHRNVIMVKNGTHEEWNSWKSRSYPRWGHTIDDENRNGIDIQPLMDFIVNSSVVAYARRQDNYHPNYIATTDHGDAVGKWFPEVLYVIDHRGVHISSKHRNITALESSTVTDKLIPTEKLMSFAWQLLQQNIKYSTRTWPRLTNLVVNNTNPSSSGFPMLYWFGDYTECNYKNWKHNLSIPLFTNAASVNCNYTFPFVTYQTGRDSNVNWTEIIPQQNMKYPWDQKLHKVIWRGGLTGKITNATHKSPRWTMVQRVQELQQEYNNNNNNNNITDESTNTLDPFVLDVAATRLPPRHKEWRPSLVTELGGLMGGITMEDFQTYRGILDMDGNSWSSRFGRLLCYNSVVLKVEPSWVDYFYFKDGWDDEEKLQPWIHYIPVKADLSDLVEMATFVADPQNDDFLINMVQNANAWCGHNMVRRRISIDILNIWERYITLLDIGNPNWVDEQWKPTKEEIFHPTNPLVMDNNYIGLVATMNSDNSDHR